MSADRAICGIDYTIGMFLKASADSASCAACTRDIFKGFLDMNEVARDYAHGE